MKFSIIVPCYNLDKYIVEALDSVLSQTCGDYECIVIDDGSTDNSPRIIDEYAKKDSRIKVIHKVNGGEGSARNAGLETAQGEFLTFLDADDVWHPMLLEVVLVAIGKFPEIGRFRFGFIDYNDGENCPWDKECANVSCQVQDTHGIVTRDFFAGATCLHVLKRKSITDLRFANYVVGADMAFMDLCIERMLKVCVIGQRLYGYRHRQGSIMHSKSSARKLIDDMLWRRDRFRMISRLGWSADREFRRFYGLYMTEWYAGEYFRLKMPERIKVKQNWFSILSEVRSTFSFTPYFNLISQLMLICRSDVFIWLLAWLPHALKRRGLHR